MRFMISSIKMRFEVTLKFSHFSQYNPVECSSTELNSSQLGLELPIKLIDFISKITLIKPTNRLNFITIFLILNLTYIFFCSVAKLSYVIIQSYFF